MMTWLQHRTSASTFLHCKALQYLEMLNKHVVYLKNGLKTSEKINHARFGNDSAQILFDKIKKKKQKMMTMVFRSGEYNVTFLSFQCYIKRDLLKLINNPHYFCHLFFDTIRGKLPPLQCEMEWLLTRGN